MNIQLDSRVILLSLLVAFLAIGFWKYDGYSDLISEKENQIEELSHEIDEKRNRETVLADSVSTLQSDLTILQAYADSLSHVAAEAVDEAVASEERPEYPEKDSVFANRFDYVQAISPGLFQVKRNLLENHLSLRDITLPAYKVAVEKLQLASKADSAVISQMEMTNAVLHSRISNLAAQIELEQSKSDGYRDLFETADQARKREKRLRVLITSGAVATILVAVLL